MRDCLTSSGSLCFYVVIPTVETSYHGVPITHFFETLPCMNLKKHLFLCFLSSILLFLHQNIFESFKKYKICRYVIFLQINDMLYGCHEDVDDVFDDKGDIYI